MFKNKAWYVVVKILVDYSTNVRIYDTAFSKGSEFR